MPQVELSLQVAPAVAVEREAIALPSEETWQVYFEQWLQRLSPPLLQQPPYELSLVLTTDADIRALNAAYRQIDAPTDVLAFAALEGEGVIHRALVDVPTPLGDIVISVETAAQQAATHNHPLALELVWLAAHGFLHLLGWDHPTTTALGQMLTQQEQMLQWVGLVAPTWSVETFGYTT